MSMITKKLLNKKWIVKFKKKNKLLKQIKVVVDKALNEVTFLLMEVTLKVTKQPNLAEWCRLDNHYPCCSSSLFCFEWLISKNTSRLAGVVKLSSMVH